MMSSPSFSVTDRFSARMAALRKALFGRCVSFGQPVMVIMLTLDYLRRADARFPRLMERYRQGKLTQPPPRKPRPKRQRPAVLGEPLAKPKRMSRAFGWFAKLIPPDGFYFADHLRETLADPEVAAALATSSQMRRFFRPLCQMFGVRDDRIALPKRPRKKPAPTQDQAARQAEREEAKRFRDLSKTSSRKSPVPPGHTFPTTEEGWAIWIRRSKRTESRRRGAKSKFA